MTTAGHLHNEVLLLWLALPRRLSWPPEEDVAPGRRLELLREKPSFSPTFFQPLLWAATARWRPPGDALKPQSAVGGVVGGVMGSAVEGELASLSSVRPSSSTCWLPRLRDVVWDRGERTCSSPCSMCSGATDSKKGTRRESFMSS